MDKKIINILHVAFVVLSITILFFVYLGLKPNPFVMTAMLAVCIILLMNSILRGREK